MAAKAMTQEAVSALRETIARMEGRHIQTFDGREMSEQTVDARQAEERFSFGIGSLDQALDGGLPLDAVTEIRSSSMKDAGAASGFALAIAALLQVHNNSDTSKRIDSPQPILWIADRFAVLEAGLPYGGGLLDFGIAIEDFLHARPRRLADALWLAEAAAASGAFAATILEVSGNLKHFGLTESRRLGLRAKAAGRPLLVLRQAGEEEASSALFRFRVETAPAANRSLADGTLLGGSIGHSVFRITLEKSRNSLQPSLLLEWNSHDRRLSPSPASTRSLIANPTPAHSGARLSSVVDRSGHAAKMGKRVAYHRAS
jgi:protein ImuA